MQVTATGNQPARAPRAAAGLRQREWQTVFMVRDCDSVECSMWRGAWCVNIGRRLQIGRRARVRTVRSILAIERSCSLTAWKASSFPVPRTQGQHAP